MKSQKCQKKTSIQQYLYPLPSHRLCFQNMNNLKFATCQNDKLKRVNLGQQCNNEVETQYNTMQNIEMHAVHGIVLIDALRTSSKNVEETNCALQQYDCHHHEVNGTGVNVFVNF